MRATRKSSVHGVRRRSPTNTLGFKYRRSTELTVKTASNSRGEPFDYWLATFRENAAVRNRALLLIGVAGALGNSDLAAIRVESLKWHVKGVAIDLPQTIYDGAKRRTVEIPFCNRRSAMCGQGSQRLANDCESTGGKGVS
jgi:hypothetical protein